VSDTPLKREYTISTFINQGETASIPFTPITMFSEGGISKKIVCYWLIICLFIIPSSLVTRIFEWTGIPLEIGGLSVYLTIYIPMLFCVPMVIWLGYFWGAIPAYLSTFVVASYGGMPIEWNLVFSLSNPLSLAMYSLFYKITNQRPSLISTAAVVGFVLVSFVASLAGSSGAFLWAFTNNVGLNSVELVWQGWWLGGWVQTVLVVLPLMHFGNRLARKTVAPLSKKSVSDNQTFKLFGYTMLVFTSILIAFVWIVRMFGINEISKISDITANSLNAQFINNTIDSLTYPLYILLMVMMALMYLIYRAVLYWHLSLISANKKLTEQNTLLQTLATTDSLTGLQNRRDILNAIEIEFDRTKRSRTQMSVLMIDIDNFKRINDNYGHIVGDNAIRDVAKSIGLSIRPYDIAGRYGGEEFVVLLPNSDIQVALDIGKRILENVKTSCKIQTADSYTITVNIGAAQMIKTETSSQSTIENADRALLKAKRLGKDQVVIAELK
jgi:diguanylate cyclase (GGDEF)-like protein